MRAPPHQATGAQASRRYAARYACQAVGMVGLATWMKTCGAGVRGCRTRRIPTCRGSELPLRRLHGAQEATMFSQLEVPPLDLGTTWSTVRLAREPQY